MATQICPYLHFPDAKQAIEWLERVAGFETLTTVEDDGHLRHAECRLGSVVVMLCEVDASKGHVSTIEAGGRTGSTYIIMKNREALQAHHRHAKAQDPASISTDIHETEYGSLDYSLKHQGHLFNFGTYAPGT